MPLIDHTIHGKRDKVRIAIERIKAHCPIAMGVMDEPYIVAYSGGKDSDALRILFDLAGVRHDLVHNHTTADAPETVRHVRSIPGIQVSYPGTSMWGLIRKNGMPPTRQVRYCCSALKERGGRDRFTATGVRWAESARRKRQRGLLEVQTKLNKDKLILNNDNAENRRMFETCALKGRRVVNPIVDWGDEDVWEFLGHHGCASNPLYAEGRKRVGCVACPLAPRKQRLADFERWPRFFDMYLSAFRRMIAIKAVRAVTETTWKTAQEVMDWWLAPEPGLSKALEAQMSLSDYEEHWG